MDSTKKSNIHHNIYYLYIFEFRFCYNIIIFIILPFYIIFSTIYHRQRHWMNLQIQSIPNLKFDTQCTCQFILRSPNIISYLINNNVCPFCQRKKTKTIIFYIPKIPSRMMQASQTMTTYSLVIQQEKNLYHSNHFNN